MHILFEIQNMQQSYTLSNNSLSLEKMAKWIKNEG